MRQAHDIKYQIHGHEQQYVNIELDPGEAVVGENGAMLYFESGIQMSTRLGDGSDKHKGLIGSMIGAAKLKMSGEGAFLGHFENKSSRTANIAFAAQMPGSIVAIDLSYHQGHVMCQRGAFLAAAKGVSVSVGLTKRLSSSMFGGEGFVLQSLKGDGVVFLHSGGTLIERELQPGEKLYLDTGNLVALDKSVDFDIAMVKGMSNMLFGQEGLFLTTLTGPGKVWMQSLPMAEFSAAMFQHMVEAEFVEPKKKKK